MDEMRRRLDKEMEVSVRKSETTAVRPRESPAVPSSRKGNTPLLPDTTRVNILALPRGHRAANCEMCRFPLRDQGCQPGGVFTKLLFS